MNMKRLMRRVRAIIGEDISMRLIPDALIATSSLFLERMEKVMMVARRTAKGVT